MLFKQSRQRQGLMLVTAIFCLVSFPAAGLHLSGILPDSKPIQAAEPTDKKPAQAPEVKTLATFNRYPDWVAGVSLHPTAPVVATGSYGLIQVYDYVARKQIVSLEEKAGFVRSVAFSPDGKWLGTASVDKTAKLWNAQLICSEF